jgi:hypothetical protein
VTEDSTELYYVEMESARNEAEDAYFKARPQLARTTRDQNLFRAGFERAFQRLWNQRQADPAERWEKGFRNIVSIVRAGPRSEFEIPDIVEEVRKRFPVSESEHE